MCRKGAAQSAFTTDTLPVFFLLIRKEEELDRELGHLKKLPYTEKASPVLLFVFSIALLIPTKICKSIQAEVTVDNHTAPLLKQDAMNGGGEHGILHHPVLQNSCHQMVSVLICFM